MNPKENAIKISFIVTTYNAGRYLDPCLDSIFRQNMDAYEILCIDDGSTDGTYEKLLRLSETCEQLTVCQNETNRGASFSRNLGIQKARGKYVWMVDQDDLLCDQAAQALYELGEEYEADAVLGRCFYILEDRVSNPPLTAAKVRPADFADSMNFYQTDQDGSISYGIWLGIFRRSFLVEQGLRFREELTLLEDVMFYFELGLTSEKIFLTDRFSYRYRIRAESMSHKNGKNRAKMYYVHSMQVLELFRSYERTVKDERFRDSIKKHIADRKRMAVYYLVQVLEPHYAAKRLKEMKQKGDYPCRYSLKPGFRAGKKTVFRYALLQSEPVFWMTHFALWMKSKLESVGTVLRDSNLLKTETGKKNV